LKSQSAARKLASYEVAGNDAKNYSSQRDDGKFWPIPPSLQDGISFYDQPGTSCLANFRLSLRDENLLRLQLRKQNHVADAFLAEQHHAQAVNADAAGGRHAVFERDEKIFVQFLLLAAGLMFERGALRDGIVLLGVAGRNFLTVDAHSNTAIGIKSPLIHC